MSTASTPPTVLPASTVENSKDWNENNGNNTIINGQNHLNSIHVSDKSMLIISSWNFFKIDSLKCQEFCFFEDHKVEVEFISNVKSKGFLKKRKFHECFIKVRTNFHFLCIPYRDITYQHPSTSIKHYTFFNKFQSFQMSSIHQIWMILIDSNRSCRSRRKIGRPKTVSAVLVIFNFSCINYNIVVAVLMDFPFPLFQIIPKSDRPFI